jgi:hypothetical protein
MPRFGYQSGERTAAELPPPPPSICASAAPPSESEPPPSVPALDAPPTVAESQALPEWERELLDKQAAETSRAAALRAGRAILDAYDRSVLPISASYLADTLRMVLDAVAG